MKYVNYLFLFVAFIFSTSVFAQQAEQTELLLLPQDSFEEYEYNAQNNGKLFFNFRAEEQGVLIIAVQNPQNIETLDVAINLYDSYHQVVEQVDEDHKNKMSSEQGVLIIHGPGDYIIGVEKTRLSMAFENEANELVSELESGSEAITIQMASVFVPTTSFAPFAVSIEDVDGDYAPTGASVLSEGDEVTAMAGGVNDSWDWWKMECRFIRFIATTEPRSDDGPPYDIVLEYYDSSENEWRTQDNVTRDIRGEGDLEEIEVFGNSPMLVKVRPFFDGVELQYNITVEACLG